MIRTRLYSRSAIRGRSIFSYTQDFTSVELGNRARNSNLLRLIESYRKHGHRAAQLDPLGLSLREDRSIAALDPQRYGFSMLKGGGTRFISDRLPEPIFEPEARFDIRGLLDLPVTDTVASSMSIETITENLQYVYCSGIGYEFSHLSNKAERRYLERSLEKNSSSEISAIEKKKFYNLLLSSESFDLWLAKRFPLVKRYGLEGGESLIVALSVLLDRAGENGVEDVVLGIPHRGRLNVLTQLMDLDLGILVRKLRGLPTLAPSSPQFGDDVLSHLFKTTSYSAPTTKLHLLPNPSHLEAVTPVSQGFAFGLSKSSSILSVTVHGDAAFNGQGVVWESLNLSSVPGYNVGGSIRIIVNNQLGFTTTPSGTDFYASNLGKAAGFPIIHVNGDNIESVARALDLAMAFRNEFGKDVIIDLVVYRRHGHNELDEPAYTSPIMYQKIKSLPSVLASYEKKLLEENVITQEYVKSAKQECTEILDKSLTLNDFFEPELSIATHVEAESGVESHILKEIGKRSVDVSSITAHPRLIKTHISRRLSSLESGKGIDFATAESLAFGSLMVEGYDIRLCGQDSARGTFSQRHATFVDQSNGSIITPLQTLTSSPIESPVKPGTFEVVNSPLTEYAVLGFEQGYSYSSPKSLSIWEAQFGDFANTAQVIIDNYLCSGESKWNYQSNLTLLLPHGFDSAGPEHSSARPERFLQLSSEPLQRTQDYLSNFSLVNVTTPANYFHVLRRQMCYRKPLIVLAPKGILRLAAASSEIADISIGTSFQPVLDDPIVKDRDSIKRVVILSGKMYYDLIKQRSDRKLDNISFIRLEQLTPFPYDALESILENYKNVDAFVFAQEGPENGESYSFVAPRLAQVSAIKDRIEYISRPASSQVAAGVSSYFNREKEEIFEKIFDY